MKNVYKNQMVYVNAFAQAIEELSGVNVFADDSKKRIESSMRQIFSELLYNVVGMIDEEIAEILNKHRSTITTSRQKLFDQINNGTYEHEGLRKDIYAEIRKKIGGSFNSLDNRNKNIEVSKINRKIAYTKRSLKKLQKEKRDILNITG